MAARTVPVMFLVSEEERQALDSARAVYRRQTGGDITKSDIGRHGLRQFCEALGVAWPDAAAPPQGEAGGG